jgi:hypothetical protein
MAWETYRPFGPLKASLTEPVRQQMHQDIGCYLNGEKLPANWVSKPSIAFNQKLLQGA